MSDHTPRVTVGIPVYNGEEYLRQLLDSLLAQSYTDFEIVISDNCSTDTTEEICREYAARDSRIRYHRCEVNRGASWNFNRVVELARGEYFKWTPADDEYEPQYLEACVSVLEREPSVVLCYPRTVMIDEQSQPLEYYSGDSLHLRSPRPSIRYKGFHARFRRRGNCNPVMGLFRTSALRKTKLMAGYASPDVVLLGEMALLGEIHEVQDYLFRRRDHAKRSMRAMPQAQDRTVWYNPAKRGKVEPPTWRHFYEHAQALHRVPMPLLERLHCEWELVRWAIWHRRRLFGESSVALRFLLAHATAPRRTDTSGI
jgi:glycosyltransferase involved in cell wall biosynthesis